MNRIQTWHIFISGYTQSRQQSTGLQKAWLAAKTNFYDAPNLSTTCFFPVLPWNHDWYTLARFIQINSQKHISDSRYYESPLINIYAYSWGAGWGAMRLAHYLNSPAQYSVQNMVLADPVYRSSNPLMRWRTGFCSRYKLTRWLAPSIQIPANVKKVYSNYQINNWPRAHALIKSPNAPTLIYSPMPEEKLIHAEMDESLWFQKKVSFLASGESVA